MVKVLIAEDNLILADFMEEYLVSRGYEVCGIATTVDEAVILADTHKPDLAILDYRMARGEYGSEIRARMKDKTSMGILYASGDHLCKKLTSEHGEAYIKKPYGMNDLVCALQIVEDIKGSKLSPSTRFPKGFHLLTSPPPQIPSNPERQHDIRKNNRETASAASSAR